MEFNLFSENDKKAGFWLLINVGNTCFLLFIHRWVYRYVFRLKISNLNPRLNIELQFYNMITLSMIKKRH